MRAAMLTLLRNTTTSGGSAPTSAYMDELLPDVLEGCIEPGLVFDWVGHFEAIKIMIEFQEGKESITKWQAKRC